jgi:hypothetical protein
MLITLFSDVSQGAEDTREIILSAGQGQTRGDLSDGQKNSAWMIQQRFIRGTKIRLVGDLYRTKVGVGLDVFNMAGTAVDTEFNYSEGSQLQYLGFFITPTTCLFYEMENKVCLGVGMGTLNVNSSENRSDFGTWNYQVDYQHNFSNKIFLKIISKYIGRVEQRIEGDDSEFWLSVATLGLGYNT